MCSPPLPLKSLNVTNRSTTSNEQPHALMSSNPLSPQTDDDETALSPQPRLPKSSLPSGTSYTPDQRFPNKQQTQNKPRSFDNSYRNSKTPNAYEDEPDRTLTQMDPVPEDDDLVDDKFPRKYSRYTQPGGNFPRKNVQNAPTVENFQRKNPEYERPDRNIQKERPEFGQPADNFQRKNPEYERPARNFQKERPEFGQPADNFQRKNPEYERPTQNYPRNYSQYTQPNENSRTYLDYEQAPANLPRRYSAIMEPADNFPRNFPEYQKPIINHGPPVLQPVYHEEPVYQYPEPNIIDPNINLRRQSMSRPTNPPGVITFDGPAPGFQNPGQYVTPSMPVPYYQPSYQPQTVPPQILTGIPGSNPNQDAQPVYARRPSLAVAYQPNRYPSIDYESPAMPPRGTNRDPSDYGNYSSGTVPAHYANRSAPQPNYEPQSVNNYEQPFNRNEQPMRAGTMNGNESAMPNHPGQFSLDNDGDGEQNKNRDPANRVYNGQGYPENGDDAASYNRPNNFVQGDGRGAGPQQRLEGSGGLQSGFTNSGRPQSGNLGNPKISGNKGAPGGSSKQRAVGTGGDNRLLNVSNNAGGYRSRGGSGGGGGRDNGGGGGGLPSSQLYVS